MSHLSDDDLIAAARRARDMAHNAPKSLPEAPSEAFIMWSQEWGRLRDEIKRRGLTPPQEDVKS